MTIAQAKEGFAGAIGLPLIVKGLRTRLRPTQALSWAAITIVAASFLYALVYWNTMKNGNTTAEGAARATIVPLMFMQGIILMGLGTGAVAGGLAKERTYRLLDYHRLTPMRPSAKIIGMLLGLPIREYFMFTLTLPFVGFAAYRGGLELSILAQFYLVFLSSVLVYHMTGLAAGMAVNKPWRAGAFAQGMVVVLYLLLPRFSHFGFTFFEYLTVRPTYLGLVQQHLMPAEISIDAVREALQTYRWESVAFYSMQIPPTIFSLLVQGFALVSMYTVVSRKWRGESKLPFSKPYALGFFVTAQIFLVGSILPVLNNDLLFEGIALNAAREAALLSDRSQVGMVVTFLVMLSVSGVVALGLLHMTTPTWHQSVHGLRRLRRLNPEAKLSYSDDAATSLPLAIAIGLIACLSFLIVYRAAMAADRIDIGADYGVVLIALAFFMAVLITAQQVREQGGEKVFVMGIFAVWIVPLLGMIVVWTAFNEAALATYLALPFPGAGLYMSSVLMIDDPSLATANRELIPEQVATHVQSMIMAGLLGYTAAALSLLLRARRRWARIDAAVQDPDIRPDSLILGEADASSEERRAIPQPQAAN